MTRSVSRNQFAGAGRFELVVGQDLEGKLEPALQLVLPLFGEAARADDQATLQVPAGDQLLDQQPRHDGLARTRVVGEQEAQRLTRQHRLVHGRDLVRQRVDHRGVDRQQHGRDLVRQRVDHRGVDRQQRVEQVREADALGFGHEPEQGAVAVEAPRPPLGNDLEPVLVVAVEQLVGDRAARRLVRQLERLRAEPLHADDRHRAVGVDALDAAARPQVFESHRGNRNSCRALRTTGQRWDPPHPIAVRPGPNLPSSRSTVGAVWPAPVGGRPARTIRTISDLR